MAISEHAIEPPRKNPLTTQPIPELIRQIGVPVGIGAFFSTMFNVVDTYYGGLISNQALAALSLSFPIYFIIIALAFGLSAGNTALIGNALGEDDKEGAGRFAVQGFVYGALLSIVVTLIGLTISPFLYGVLGASGDYLQMALSYIIPIFYGTIFFVMVQMCNSVLNAVGNTRPNRNFLIVASLLNLALDPWFIFGGFGVPAMGITGIALATVLVQILGCIVLGIQVVKTGLITRKIIRKYWWPRWSVISQISQQGFPNIVDLGGVSLGFFVLTYFVSQFGQEAVAAFGAAARIEQVALLPIIGLDVASLSLIAQNNGAGLFTRIHETLNTSIRYGIIIMLIGATIITIFAPQLMDLFSDDPDVIAMGVTYVRIKAWVLPPVAFMFMSFAAMRGIKRPFHALVLSMGRSAVVPAILIVLFVGTLGYGLTAIWWSSFAANIVVAIGAYLLARRLLPR